MYFMAHRGYSGFYPENTKIAFEKSIQEGYDFLELDVRLSKDGIPVIIHDATINRTSNGGKQFVHDLTLEELKSYDYGSWFAEEFAGETILTLEELFQLVEGEEIKLNVELKNGPIIPEDLEEKVLELVNKYNLGDRILFSSFDHRSMERLYKLDNTIKAGLVFHVNLIDMYNYIDSLDMKVYSVHPNYFYITEEMVKEAHKRGIKVNAYTVDDIDLAKDLKKMNIDGLITNKLSKV